MDNKEYVIELLKNIDIYNFNWGVKEASYFLGFMSILKTLDLPDETVENIILTKMSLDYGKQNISAQLESNEYIATRLAKSLPHEYDED